MLFSSSFAFSFSFSLADLLPFQSLLFERHVLQLILWMDPMKQERGKSRQKEESSKPYDTRQTTEHRTHNSMLLDSRHNVITRIWSSRNYEAIRKCCGYEGVDIYVWRILMCHTCPNMTRLKSLGKTWSEEVDYLWRVNTIQFGRVFAANRYHHNFLTSRADLRFRRVHDCVIFSLRSIRSVFDWSTRAPGLMRDRFRELGIDQSIKS